MTKMKLVVGLQMASTMTMTKIKPVVGLQMQMYRTYENVLPSPTLEIWATQIKLQDILVSQLYMQMELMHHFPRETIKLILLHQVSESIPRVLQHATLFYAEEVNPIT